MKTLKTIALTPIVLSGLFSIAMIIFWSIGKLMVMTNADFFYLCPGNSFSEVVSAGIVYTAIILVLFASFSALIIDLKRK